MALCNVCDFWFKLRSCKSCSHVEWFMEKQNTCQQIMKSGQEPCMKTEQALQAIMKFDPEAWHDITLVLATLRFCRNRSHIEWSNNKLKFFPGNHRIRSSTGYEIVWMTHQWFVFLSWTCLFLCASNKDHVSFMHPKLRHPTSEQLIAYYIYFFVLGSPATRVVW